MQTLNEKTPDALYASVAPWIITGINAAIRDHGLCALGIVGGRSTSSLLSSLGMYAHTIEGPVHVFWLDERVGAEKNATDAIPHLERLRAAGVDLTWYSLLAEERDAILAECNFALEALERARGRRALDVIIASAGEDGHVASLFPHHAALNTRGAQYTLVTNAPKPPSTRVSVTPELLTSVPEAFLFFVGDKTAAYAAFSEPRTQPVACPAKLLLVVPQLTVCVSLNK